MTVEELKAEAKKLGYTVIKKSEPVKILPCICGKNRRERWYRGSNIFYKCAYCGFKSPEANTDRQANLNWNEAVKETKSNETLG